MSISKLNDHQARPFWVANADVQAYGCSNQYGNPSGHCMDSLGISLTIWLDYNSETIKRQSAMKMGSWYWRLFWFVCVLTFAATIAYSRMFLGVHALN